VIRTAARRLRTSLVATMRGEFSAAGLDGLRRAGAAAYELAEDAEGRRQAPGWSVWGESRDAQLSLVCVWNAFALQTAADQLLESDWRNDPATDGFLPESMLAFAQQCYGQVVRWLEHARCVQADPSYRPKAMLPAALPVWSQLEQVRLVHVRGLRDAYDALAPRAEFDLARLAATAPAGQRELGEMSILAERMRSALERAGALGSHARSRAQLAEQLRLLVQSLGFAFTLGQLVAMPSLVERLELVGYRVDSAEKTAVPVTAIERGWPVLDCDGTRIGTVVGLEGEPELGHVTGLAVSLGLFSANRSVRIDQIQGVERGVVRLCVDKSVLDAG
jgi:hypothetical protein